MFIPPLLLAKAEILHTKFLRDARGGPSDDVVVNTVTWLIETFAIKRSLELTLAISRKIGDGHCLRSVREDGSTGFALITEDHQQIGEPAVGTGITILGRASIAEIAQALSGETEPRLQIGIAPSERTPMPKSNDPLLLKLASCLPWYRGVLNLPENPIETMEMIKTCLQLGMPEAFAKKS